jgi:hypothetical protein
MAMLPDYFKTHFRTPAAVTDWPAEFAIVSAYATTGEKWADHVNQGADRRLEQELKQRGDWFVRISGYSPKTGHTEPSWAVSMPFAEACELGQLFKQDAIYYVTGNALSVSYCDKRRALVLVGEFRSRL